jgi:hypothetical protein
LATLWAWHRGCAAAIVNSTTFLASSRDSILQVPVEDSPRKEDTSPTASTLRDDLAGSGQRLLAASEQILAAQSPDDGSPSAFGALLDPNA